MTRLWSPRIRGIVPYTAGEQPRIPGLIKLNTNENPYGPAPEVAAAIAEAAGDSLRLYPDPQSSALRECIARHHGLRPEQVFLGNGSDEVLAFAFMALLDHGEPVLFPDVSYSFYPVYCGLFGIPFRAVPVNASFEIDAADYAVPAGGVVLPNPNAPTGVALPLESIEALLRAQPDRAVVIDEAYVDFGAQSAVSLIDRHPNLLVVQTLSKSRSLAGLRVGYALGAADLVAALDRVKDSFNSYPLDRLAQAGAMASFGNDAYFRDTCRRVIATRERLISGLASLGFDVLPSSANFVFATHPDHDAATLAAALRERAILVRHFRQPRIAQHLRITVGTDAQCERLVEVLRTLV